MHNSPRLEAAGPKVVAHGKRKKEKRKKERSPTTKLNKSLEHGLNLSRS